MAHTLPPLPYDYAALEPHIDARTMEIHHTKHHQAYVNNLNAALEKAPQAQSQGLDALLANLNAVPDAVRTAVRNNGGGHWNHTLFWQIMGPNAGGEPQGALGNAINSSFGGFDTGWAWLVRSGDKLSITSTPNQDNPLMEGTRAQDVLLGLDVWEHAYYLLYQNRRPDYVKAWWNVVNWGEVGKRFGGK